LTTSVLLVDDEDLVRSGLRLLLATDEQLAVVAEARNGAEAVTLTRELSPDVVLLDLHMPVLDGLAAIPRLHRANGVPPKVVVLTTFGDDRNVWHALRLGASGFLLKTSRPDDLRRAVHGAADGEQIVSPSVLRSLVDRFLGQPTPGELDPRLAALTARELDVLRLVASGRSNAEVGGELFLSEATVKSHVNSILRKLDLRDRVQATVFAYETGAVRPGDHG
jgi:DNA-binding NarL/FixJ family response regulator